jgi:hypothetical protein
MCVTDNISLYADDTFSSSMIGFSTLARLVSTMWPFITCAM